MRSNQVRLNCGITVPVIGLGTYSFQNNRKTTELAVHMALKMGYRHFDTAKIYGSEPALGNALTMAMHDGEVEREDIFVTSKLWGSDHHDPVPGLKQTLNACWFSAGSPEIPMLDEVKLVLEEGQKAMRSLYRQHSSMCAVRSLPMRSLYRQHNKHLLTHEQQLPMLLGYC